MKKRFFGLVGIVICIVLIKLAWTHLSGGEGIMRNVGRNTIIGLLFPVSIYSLALLFGNPQSKSESSKDEK